MVMDKASTDIPDFATQHPELLSSWDYKKNTVNPSSIPSSYSKSIFWVCSKGHSWKTSISNRIKQGGCPYCRGRKIWPGFNDLATLYPDLLREWDYQKNTVKPDTVAPANAKKYWWLCPKGHSYEAAVSSRTRLKTGCPYCANQKLLKGFNDFETLYPDLALEWDYEKNEGKKPSDYISGSETYAWWKCRKGHSWHTMISTRVSGTGCPTCAKEYKTSVPEQAVFYYCSKYYSDAVNRYQPDWLGRSELDVYIPSLCTAIEYDGRVWHKDVEKDIQKNKLCTENGIRVLRIREPGLQLFNEDCIGFEKISYDSLSTAISTLLIKLGISSPDVNVSRDLDNVYALMDYQEKEQSISNKYPQIAAEWDYERNSKYLSPQTVNCNAKILAYWICPLGHRYEARIEHRTRSGSGCPICDGKKVLAGFNDLASQKPELAKEWDYSNNQKLPTEVHYSASKKYWWVCALGHKWEASPGQRVRHGSGCPYCAGQKAIPGVTDFATVEPELVKEWDYEKNSLSPQKLLPRSRERVWWKCSKGHSWQDSIRNRAISKHRYCPICQREKREEPMRRDSPM